MTKQREIRFFIINGQMEISSESTKYSKNNFIIAQAVAADQKLIYENDAQSMTLYLSLLQSFSRRLRRKQLQSRLAVEQKSLVAGDGPRTPSNKFSYSRGPADAHASVSSSK